MPQYPYDQLGTPLDTANLEKANGNWAKIAADIASVASASQQRDDALSSSFYSQLFIQRNEYTGRLDFQRSDYMTRLAAQRQEYTSGFQVQKTRIDNIVSEISDEAFDSVVDAAKLNWKPPVANFAALSTSYPDAVNGDASQTLDDNKTYRYNGTQWVFIQQFGNGPFTDVYNRLEEQRYFVSVEEFGAVGDGVSDDTQSFQDAILAARTRKRKTIKVPAGAYRITSPLDVGNNTVDEWNLRLLGDGADVDGRGTSLVVDFDGYVVETDLNQVAGGWRGVQFEHMAVKSNSPKFSKGFKIVFAQQASFKDVYFINLDRALVCTGNTHYPLIERCKFYGNRYGVLVPKEGDEDFVPGNSNNGELTGCWFEENEFPITLGDGTEWKIRDTDVEGNNGPTEISSENVLDNVRFERNLFTERWLILRGDSNRVQINVHGIGGAGVPDWRVFVDGTRNKVSINSRYTPLLCTETKAGNDFDIQLVKTAGYDGIDSNIMIISKRSTLKVNGVYQSRKPIRQFGENLATSVALQGVSNASGSKTDEHGIAFTSYAISATRNLVSYGTTGVPISTSSDDTVFFSSDVYVESTLPFVELTAVSNVQMFILNEWATVYAQRNVNAGVTNPEFLVYKDRVGSETGKVIWGLGRIAINQQPVNTFKPASEVVTGQSVLEQLHEDQFSLGQFTPTTSQQFNTLPSGFPGVTFKNETLAPMKRVGMDYRVADDYGLRYFYATSPDGAIPSGSVYAEIIGYSSNGGTKYVKTTLSRSSTSDNFTNVPNTLNVGLGGASITGGNPVGSIAGSGLTGMKFIIKYY